MPKNALAPPSVNALQPASDVPKNALAQLYSAYQQYVGQPFAQTVRGGMRGYFGLPLMSDADATGREAYRQGEALGFMPGVGMPAGAVRVAAEGMQALPAVAGEIGRVIASMPRRPVAVQAEDFAKYQRSIPPSDVSPLTAFHGTPHKFEPTAANPLGEFRAAKIGTGEGAQAYGHGLYFAESPGVAKGYQTTLLPKNFASIIEKGRNNFDVIAPNGEVLASNVLRGPAQRAKDAFDAKQTGSLYTVDIPDSMVEKMLDWDKPLNKQSAEIQSKLKSIVDAQIGPGVWNSWIKNEPDFRNLKDDLFENKTDAEVSALLRQAGIPGIRYLDAGSRGGADGTRNIVVFPGEESKVKILKRD